MSEQTQQKDEILSAFIDAEQSDIETTQIIDLLLTDSDYKACYARAQLNNDYLHEQVQNSILSSDLRKNIQGMLQELPAHFVDEAVVLQTVATGNIKQSHWFNRLFENKLLSGLSVAASVMFVTLFTLQAFDTDTTTRQVIAGTAQVAQNSVEKSVPLPVAEPSLISASSELPVSFVSTAASNANHPRGALVQQKYQWIEADPTLSRQVRQYINEHEMRRAAYNLQPKIRTATYQVSD